MRRHVPVVRRVRLALVLLAAVVLIAGAPGGPVAAHSGLSAASPAPGAVVGGEVTEIDLWYGSAVTDISASITAPDGEVLDARLVQRSSLRIALELAEPLSVPGEYAVRHGTTGVDDGDRIDAAYLFSFDPAAPSPALVILPDDDGVSIWLIVVIVLGVLVIAVLGWRLLSSMRAARRSREGI